MNKKKKCNCPICNSGIEERQYAYMKMDNQFVLIDATELAHIEEFFENKKKMYPEIEVDDNKELKLVYGVIIPQAGQETKSIIPTIEGFKNYAFACLVDGKCYLSAYEDIMLYPYFENTSYGHIPFAGLFRTDLQVDNDKQFAYTLYLRYENMSVLDNVFCRDFVIAVKRKEEVDININHWKEQINLDKLMTVAKGIV